MRISYLKPAMAEDFQDFNGISAINGSLDGRVRHKNQGSLEVSIQGISYLFEEIVPCVAYLIADSVAHWILKVR